MSHLDSSGRDPAAPLNSSDQRRRQPGSVGDMLLSLSVGARGTKGLVVWLCVLRDPKDASDVDIDELKVS